jgi:hypothetical protein
MPPEQEQPGEQSTPPPAPEAQAEPYSDPTTDRAVDDIVAHESDELLHAQDEALARQTGTKVKRARRGFWRWWLGKGWPRRITLLLLFAGLVAAGVWPTSRYWVLNTAGVRASASIVAEDDLTGQPLKGVEFIMGGRTVETDSEGKAVIRQLKLGSQPMRIEQTGFSNVTQTTVVGWGSNPLGTFKLKAVGVRYTVLVKDHLSGQSIAGAEVTNGDATAVSDQKGKAVLTLAAAEDASAPVKVAKAGYRTEQIALLAPNQSTPATLLTDRKAVFVQRDNNTYNVYKSDADGQHRELLLAGTGNENANIGLVTSPDGTRAALVSTRDNQRDADGFLLSTLTLINISDGQLVTLAHAEQIQLIDWVGPRLVFEQVSSDPKTPVSSRTTIVAYDAAGNARLQLAAANSIGAVFSAQGAVYYAVTSSDADPAAHPAFYKIGTDGAGKQTILDKEVWSGYRSDYNTLSLQTADGWVTYALNNGTQSPVTAPVSYTSRQYADNAGRTESLWIDTGLGSLLRYTIAGSKETAVHTQPGLSYPLRWLTDDAVIYRVVTGSETADYAASINGGAPLKVADVVNTYGFSHGL